MNLAILAAIQDSHSIGRWLRSKAYYSIRQTGQDTGTRRCSVWVTLDGDMRDVILDAGQAFNVDRKQRTLIQAPDTARGRLIEPTCGN